MGEHIPYIYIDHTWVMFTTDSGLGYPPHPAKPKTGSGDLTGSGIIRYS